MLSFATFFCSKHTLRGRETGGVVKIICSIRQLVKGLLCISSHADVFLSNTIFFVLVAIDVSLP